MRFPKDEELFRNIPTKRNQRAFDFLHTTDSASGDSESICSVFDRSYREAADKTISARKGIINDIYTQEEINKDFNKIAHEIYLALDKHLYATNGYIGAFPESRKYYATVAKCDDYYFDFLNWCGETPFALTYELSQLNMMVSEERFSEIQTKSALSLTAAIVSAALMWFFQGWFFIYEGFAIIKLAALAAIFVGLLILLWLSSQDPDEFALGSFTDDSPAGYLGIGVVAAVLVRIFLSETTAAIVCCTAAGLIGVCFLIRTLSAHKRLNLIRSRSPKLRELSSSACEHFERSAKKAYRLLRFYELWHEYENHNKNNRHLESIRRNFMTHYIDEYDQWRHKYLRDNDNTGF